MSTVFSYTPHCKTNNMAAVEEIGTSSVIKEQYEKHKKFGKEVFYFLLPKTKNKEDGG